MNEKIDGVENIRGVEKLEKFTDLPVQYEINIGIPSADVIKLQERVLNDVNENREQVLNRLKGMIRHSKESGEREVLVEDAVFDQITWGDPTVGRLIDLAKKVGDVAARQQLKRDRFRSLSDTRGMFPAKAHNLELLAAADLTGISIEQLREIIIKCYTGADEAQEKSLSDYVVRLPFNEENVSGTVKFYPYFLNDGVPSGMIRAEVEV